MKICFFIIVLLSTATTAFSQDKNQKQEQEYNFDFIWNAKAVASGNMDSVLKNLSDSLAVEFINIYPVSTVIPQNDRSKLVSKLLQLKFVKVNSGRGNWMKGPRILNYFLESDRFVCCVDKLYYEDLIKPNRYTITERIGCLIKKHSK